MSSVAIAATLSLAAMGAPDGAVAAETTVLYKFDTATSGRAPMGAPIEGPGGFYGTTAGGGKFGGGTIYRLSGDGAVTVLHDFAGPDGREPSGGLAKDEHGVFYGVTSAGGAHSVGVVYRITSKGDFELLHSFSGGRSSAGQPIDGADAQGRLVVDKNGNLIGTTYQGGIDNHGTVFKVAPDGTESLLQLFRDDSRGTNPIADLIADADGNLYGTASAGGEFFAGTIFKLAPDGRMVVLHSFSPTDGRGLRPTGGVTMDGDGNLYGMTPYGGDNNLGTIYKLALRNRVYTQLFSFNGSNGRTPYSRLLIDADGNLYGGTSGGGKDCDCGTAFKLTKGGQFFTLHRFSGKPDGAYIAGDLTFNRNGNIIGAAQRGGDSDNGTLFRITVR